jgi:hypothetical protein
MLQTPAVRSSKPLATEEHTPRFGDCRPLLVDVRMHQCQYAFATIGLHG